MSVTHKITYSLNRGSGIPNQTAQSEVTSESEQKISVLVPVQADYNILLDFLTANLKSVVIFAGDALTIETNSSSAPSNTFAVDSDKPLVWNTKSLGVNPFTANVTTIYATNATADPVQLDIILLYDVTP